MAKTTAKKWYTSKTLWINAIVFTLAVLDAYNASFGIPAEVYAFAIPVLNGMLRLVTETKLTA